jgi:hypothetical protein
MASLSTNNKTSTNSNYPQSSNNSSRSNNNNNNNTTIQTSTTKTTTSATHKLPEGRLTRAAFTRTLQTSRGKTVFDIQGLRRLKHTFATLDADVAADETIVEGSAPTTSTATTVTTTTPVATTTTAVTKPPATRIRKLPYEACKALLDEAAGTEYDKSWLPDAPDREYSELLSQPKEFYGSDFTPPCTKEQVAMLKRDRNQFTAAEDSLVFRGVVRIPKRTRHQKVFIAFVFSLLVRWRRRGQRLAVS